MNLYYCIVIVVICGVNVLLFKILRVAHIKTVVSDLSMSKPVVVAQI